jgi:phosphoribosyl-dephospho-CoA transferase
MPERKPESATRADVKPMLRRLRRHWLVWVAKEFHAQLALQVADAKLRTNAAEFLAAGWPLVVCTQQDEASAQGSRNASLAAGMPLPPHQGKLRLRFLLPKDSIARVAPPLLLPEAILALPERWRTPLWRLLEQAQAIDLELRVFGSAAWESLTRMPYLTPRSDIDLLWQPHEATQIESVLAMLTHWEAQSGLAADGEILFGDDAAVAWREWQQAGQYSGANRVLVKSLRGPQLSELAELLARLTPRRLPPSVAIRVTA